MRCLGIIWAKTSDAVPNEALYQAEPQPEKGDSEVLTSIGARCVAFGSFGASISSGWQPAGKT